MKLKIAVMALALLAAACGGDDADAAETTGAPAAETTTTATPTTAAPEVTETAAPVMTVALAESGLGEVVVDGDGNSLYLFVPDGQGASVCNGDCAEVWPPLVGDVVAGDGLDAGLLGSVARDDGAEQVTLNGWPLYYFAGDAAVGDTNGQGVNDVWYVLDSAGNGLGLPEADAAGAGVTVALVESGLGEIVVDGDGNTLYLFVPDGQGASVCNGDCAEAWPPLVGDAVAGDGLDAGLLGSVARDDGAEQVTLNGWPLYYFAGDAAVGDTNGQGVNDVWYVLDSAGDAID